MGAWRRLVRDAERAGEGRVRQSAVLRLSGDEHQERRRIQGSDARRGRRVLGANMFPALLHSSGSERGGARFRFVVVAGALVALMVPLAAQSVSAPDAPPA